MTFQPLILSSGNVGWSFLIRTREAQEAAFENSAAIQSKSNYFLENIQSVASAAELVVDRRLLEVTLGAFGLDEDIDNRFFIEKVLVEGTRSDDAFANKLADKRYFALSEALSFDLEPPNTVLSTFGPEIVSRYSTRQFEKAVGNQDENLRLALGFERELNELIDKGRSLDGAWFTIMGTPPIRAVFEAALGLPTQIGALDIDRQLSIFKDKLLQVFGTNDPNQLIQADQQERLVRLFLLRSDTNQANLGSSSGRVALSLLQANT